MTKQHDAAKQAELEALHRRAVEKQAAEMAVRPATAPRCELPKVVAS